MISYVTTSLFDSPAQTLVNTVNTVGVMGKGIAAEFKRRYPAMYATYREACSKGLFEVGKLQLYKSPNKWVLNFPTKQDWRRPSKLEWIEAGLQKFVETYTDRGITSVAFPMLGCGNGQLDWDTVRPVMERYLSTLPIPVFIHVASAAALAPEHMPPAALEADREARETITFLRFWNDLRRAVGQEHVAEIRDDDEEEDALALPVDGGATTLLPRSGFEDLFHMLRLKGALSTEEYPPELAERGEYVTQLLLELPYVKPIEFLTAGNSRRSTGPGVRFAPPPSVLSRAAVSVASPT